MRFDKFTTKFQQALADAQSLAVGSDNQFIEPQHLLLAPHAGDVAQRVLAESRIAHRLLAVEQVKSTFVKTIVNGAQRQRPPSTEAARSAS